MLENSMDSTKQLHTRVDYMDGWTWGASGFQNIKPAYADNTNWIAGLVAGKEAREVAFTISADETSSGNQDTA